MAVTREAGGIRRQAELIFAAIGWLVFVTPLAVAADSAVPVWPQFRGPNATGVAAPGAHPPQEFGPESHLRWKAPVPSGASSPVISGNRIFLTAFDSGHLEVLCLDRGTGAVLWRRQARSEGIEPVFEKYGSPAAPSCATDGKHIVSYFGSCGLLCHDFEGNELWTVPMPVVHTDDGFGTGSSPIIHDDKVYLLRDETGDWRGLFAFDVHTGKKLWRTSREEFAVSYGTPVVWDGCLVCIGDLRAKGYDLETGHERWLFRGLAAYPCTTPAAGEDGNLYISTWSSGSANEPNPDYDQLLKQYDSDHDGKLSEPELSKSWLKDFFEIMDDNKNGFLDREEWDDIQVTMRKGQNVVACLRPGGSGDITESHVVWKNSHGMGNVASPLAYAHRLFLVRDGGFATSYETGSGKVLYERQRLDADGNYHASPVLGGDAIYVCSTHGVVTVINANSEKLQILARNPLGEPISATPAIVGNAIYIRTNSNLWAFETAPNP